MVPDINMDSAVIYNVKARANVIKQFLFCFENYRFISIITDVQVKTFLKIYGRSIFYLLSFCHYVFFINRLNKAGDNDTATKYKTAEGLPNVF
jgi:hypothetical protein